MGKIFNIQKFCINDGPGIRTAVFMKGCPLRCIWCHNPESHAISTQLLYDEKCCVNCMRCVAACPNKCHIQVDGKHGFLRGNCVGCGKCVQAGCLALETTGYEISVDEVMNKVMEDVLFYQTSGGGVTLSGGEPFYQKDFALQILKKAKENGINTCVETCGFADRRSIEETAPFIDLYLLDYKETNPELHKKYTGADNRIIIENLKYLDRVGKRIILRCPIIPDCNDREDHFKGIAELANALKNIERIEIEPYHSYGEEKYEKLGKEYALSKTKAPSNALVDSWIKSMKKYTKKEVVKG